ncbi:O-methyltransferase [Mycobacterium tuberculosis]|nr:O-methyltransferase [Mycobacterium tuberculosis]
MDQQPNPPDVDAFLDSTLVGDDPALAAALAASDAAELPRIAVSAQQGKFLCLLAGAIQARRVLEIGTLVASAPFGWRVARAHRDGWSRWNTSPSTLRSPG